MLYDTHAHPYLATKKSQEQIFENFFDSEGTYLNTIGTNLDTSKMCVEIAKKNDGIFGVIGIHPCDIFPYRENITEAIQTLKQLYRENSDIIVAIGETGLDYYWLQQLSTDTWISQKNIIAMQEIFFRAQIQLAQDIELPIVIHTREASEDTLKILQSENMKNFVFHCYSNDLSFAQKILEYSPNAKLGFWGTLTFKNADTLRETVKHIPLSSIIIETDSPYLTPAPYRWKQENEPLYCKYVLDMIIDIREESSEKITQQIFDNSLQFFRISHPFSSERV